jgi:PTH2 family peptidyl-tRNA hydrolase
VPEANAQNIPEDPIRQMLIIRKDLKMRRGKEIAQMAHASMGIFFRRMERIGDSNEYRIVMTDDMVAWKEGVFAKVCLQVNSEEELLAVYAKAEAAGLPCILIEDRGLTEFHGVLTRTCVALGPARKSQLDPITGDLPLY